MRIGMSEGGRGRRQRVRHYLLLFEALAQLVRRAGGRVWYTHIAGARRSSQQRASGWYHEILYVRGLHSSFVESPRRHSTHRIHATANPAKNIRHRL